MNLVEGGAVFLYRGRVSEAEKLLREAVASEGSVQAHALLANALQVQWKFSEARRTLAAGLDRAPLEPALHFRLARSCEFEGDRPAMRRAFGRFVELERRARLPRFQAFMAMDAFAEAFREAETIVDAWDPQEADGLSCPWDDDLCHWRSDAYYRERLRRLDAFDGERAVPWTCYFGGLLRLHLKSFPAALAEFHRIKRFPSGRYAWMRYGAGLARLFSAAGAQDDAATDFEAALECHSDAAWARGRLAEARLCQGRKRGAFALFDEAEAGLSGEKQKSHLRAWRGEALLWLGRWTEARRELDGAVRGGSQLAFCWRGGARLLGGDAAGAREDLDRAVALDPADAEALVWRGELHRRAGRLGQAISDLDLAVARRGGPLAHVNRALARAARGDAAGMRKDLALLPTSLRKRVAALFPDPVRGLEALLTCARGVRRPEPYLEALFGNG